MKLGRRPATNRTFLLLAALIVLIYLSLGMSATAASEGSSATTIRTMLSLPDAHGSLAGLLLIFGGVTGAAYAGAVAASEWGWNTFRVALTRGESRVRYVLGLFAAFACLALVAWVALYLLGIVLILVAAVLGGISAGAPFDPAYLPRVIVLVASGGWAVLMEISLGFAVAFITRSQVAGIGTVTGLFFAERFAEMVVPADLMRYAPITAATTLVSSAGTGGPDAGLGLPLVMTTLYMVAALVLAGVVAPRSEVT